MSLDLIEKRLGFNPLDIYKVEILNDWACDDRERPEDLRKKLLTPEEIEFIENYILNDPNGWETRL